MTEDTKQLIVVFTAIILGIVIVAASKNGYSRSQTNCVVLAAQSGWSAKDAREACK